jgi:hypothetical protein
MEFLCGAFPDHDVQVLEAALQTANQDVNIAFEQLIDEPPFVARDRYNPRDIEVIALHTASPAKPSDLEDGGDLPRQSDRTEHSSDQEVECKDDAVAKLLQLFPDACIAFLKHQYDEHHGLHDSNVVEFLANRFIEGGYSRIERVGQKRKRDCEGEMLEITNYDRPDRPPETWEYYDLM